MYAMSYIQGVQKTDALVYFWR